MLSIDNTEVFGWEAAIRGMRNPMNSWDKSDSIFDDDFCIAEQSGDVTPDKCESCKLFDGFGRPCIPKIGENDFKLMKTLANAGTDHRKYLRMINVTTDVNAPLYWWKEYDTYKVGTVANSCSTMHKITAKVFTMDDFSIEHLYLPQSQDLIKDTIDALNYFRDVYINGGYVHLRNGNDRVFEPKDKDIWWQMIQLLPTSYNQKRTIQLNYEVLVHIYHSRKNHKLDEWHTFCDWIESLPYFKDIFLQSEA